MPKKPTFEIQVLHLALLAALPPLVLLVWVMAYAEISIWLIGLTGLLGGLCVAYCGYAIQQKLNYQFRSLSNLLEALIHGDYSMRARVEHSGGALEQLLVAVNGLANRLSNQRWTSVESQLLLRTIIDHIDVAIIALNSTNHISFVNPAAQNLLQLDQMVTDDHLLQQLAFAQQLTSGRHQVVELSLGDQQGRFKVHVEEFRDSGEQHKLLFITDVRLLLRGEERKAWQNLIRVISHEINNSLSPIASISQTLQRVSERAVVDQAIAENLREGLTIISDRAKGLGKFIDSYGQLAKLPQPQTQRVNIRQLVERIASLLRISRIEIVATTNVYLLIDPVLFEQLLINLLKNSLEAMTPCNPEGVIQVDWSIARPFFTMNICDRGCGISNLDNIFVPFYSTKKQGAGIGLVLCRQIVEAHNGRLTLRNRELGSGCCAIIELPMPIAGNELEDREIAG